MTPPWSTATAAPHRDSHGVQKTQTLVPIGASRLYRIQSTASSLTRTQPCETGTGGT